MICEHRPLLLTPYSLPQVDPAIVSSAGQFTQAAMLDAEINRQALMIAYLDDFHLMMLITLAAVPLVLLLRKASGGGGPPHAAME